MNKELKELAATLAAIADGAEWEMNFPSQDSNWQKCEVCPILAIKDGWKIRLKPRTININGFEVPEPVRVPLIHGEKYHLAAPERKSGFMEYEWCGHKLDYEFLNSGLIHLPQEAAALHGKALASFTERKEEA